MKFIFIVANWKSYKIQSEAYEWFESIYSSTVSAENKEVIICPPFPLLSPIFDLKVDLSANNRLLIRLGSQNISPFDEGAYTGEVSGRVLQEFCAYSIIGHSERRQNFNETDEILGKKVEIAKKYNITPIYCVQGKETFIPSGISIAAYEPVSAIGTGNPDTPENAEDVAKYIKEKNSVNYVLYVGSVNAENVKSFTAMEHIDGVLVGGASLDVNKFIEIIKNA
jgi:triosephosphate isomerase